MALTDGAGERWESFHAGDPSDSLASGFFRLRNIIEERFGPGAARVSCVERADVVTCILSGRIEEVRTSTLPALLRSSEVHASRIEGIEARMRAAADQGSASTIELFFDFGSVEPRWVEPRMSFCGDRSGRIQWVVESATQLKIGRARLDRGHHWVEALDSTHAAWVHVIEGEVALGDLVLSTGDGAGVLGERKLSLLGWQPTELLLIDLGER